MNKVLLNQYPIIQAPMAGVQDHKLAAAVCVAGGVGSIPAAMLTFSQLDAELIAMKAAVGDAMFNVNFFCHALPDLSKQAEQQAAWLQTLAPHYLALGLTPPPLDRVLGTIARQPFNAAACEVLERHRPPIMSFHFGLPQPDLLARVRAWGAQIWSSATTVAEAQWLESQGVDAIIAQGLEAGGHRGMFLSGDLSTQVGTFALLPQIVAAVKVPVIAAGGIANAAGVRAAMGFGAAAVQVGSAYLQADEAKTSAIHRAALQGLQLNTHGYDPRHTALTNLFTGRPARGIVNHVMQKLGAINASAPDFPTSTAAIAPLRAAAEAMGLGDYSPLWAGQHAATSRAAPAAVITAELAMGLT